MLFCNVVARTFIIGGGNEERENRALVRCIIPSIMVNAIACIFRFPANCHAPSVLLLLVVVQGIDGFAKGTVNLTIGELICELKAFKRFVRLVGRTAEYLPLDSRPRAYPRHCGWSLQIHRLAGSRHGCRSPGMRGQAL